MATLAATVQKKYKETRAAVEASSSESESDDCEATHGKEAALLLDLGVCKDTRGGLLARHRIRLVCLEAVLDGLSLVSLPKDGLDRVSHQLERDGRRHGRALEHRRGRDGLHASTLWRSAGLAGPLILMAFGTLNFPS